MKKGGKVFLFRHGQSTFNRDGKFTGSINSNLTQMGKAHAKKIASKMANKKFEVAIHTSLSRSIDTLKPTLKAHPECKVILEDNRMTERSYGDLQGSTHESFIKRIGEQEYNLRIHGDALTDIEDLSLIKRIKRMLGEIEYEAIHRGWKVAAPNGESFADVERRVKKFIKDLKKLIKKNNVNVAISAHGNSIRIFRKIIENASISQATKWTIPYDKVYTYEF